MAERSNAAVLKTVEVKASGGSNPSLSAEMKIVPRKRDFLFAAAYKVYFVKPRKTIKSSERSERTIFFSRPPAAGVRDHRRQSLSLRQINECPALAGIFVL